MVLADDGSGVEITSDTAAVLVRDGYRVVSSYEPQYTPYADALKTLGLFFGSNKGYELGARPYPAGSVDHADPPAGRGTGRACIY